MSSLQEDLEVYADELFSKKDLKAGIKIVSEILGVAGIMGVGVTIGSTFITPILGASAGMLIAKLMTREVLKRYMSLSTDERKQVRAVVKWMNNGFDLSGQMIDE